DSGMIVAVSPFLPFLLTSLSMALMLMDSSLFPLARNRRREWQPNHDGPINLIRLGNLQEELLRRLLKVRPVKDHYAIYPLARLKPGAAQPEIPDLELIRNDAFAVFLLPRKAASGYLD